MQTFHVSISQSKELAASLEGKKKKKKGLNINSLVSYQFNILYLLEQMKQEKEILLRVCLPVDMNLSPLSVLLLPAVSTVHFAFVIIIVGTTKSV